MLTGLRGAVAPLTVLAVLSGASPAAAHPGSAGDDASYYRAAVTSVTPQVPGLTVRTDHHGEWIEVTGKEVQVLGYLKEPYLRITAAGVQENQLSPTTFLNRSLFQDATAAGKGSATATPVWKTVSSGATARWHDHRIHWMGTGRPPAVAKDPEHPHALGPWTVHVVAGSTPVAIDGTLSWAGKPAPAELPVGWITAGVLAVFAVVVGFLRLRRRGQLPEPAVAVTGDDEPSLPEELTHRDSHAAQ
jgi:hypothetical protein